LVELQFPKTQTLPQFPPTKEYYKTFLHGFTGTHSAVRGRNEGLSEFHMRSKGNVDDPNFQSDLDAAVDEGFAYARENYVRLHVYYDDLQVMNIEQEKAYELYNFVGECAQG